jgi:pimeloyl-ACP methyl ester carboxylesterase
MAVLRWSVFLAPLLAATLWTGAALAQAFAVSPTYKGLFSSSDPTMTFLFEAPEAKATLVFVPGGEGHHGIHAKSKARHAYFSFYPFNVMLRGLSDPGATSGRFNVVIFDSPERLLTTSHWSAAREGTAHLSRVEDVVRFYRDRLGKPVWVMGHSMGSISVTELYKRLQDGKRQDLVAGLILSAPVGGTSLDYRTTRLPVLVLYHERDGCASTPPEHARTMAAKLRESGNLAARLSTISGGGSGGDPCFSGFHMYEGAEPDAARAIDEYMGRNIAPAPVNQPPPEERK